MDAAPGGSREGFTPSARVIPLRGAPAEQSTQRNASQRQPPSQPPAARTNSAYTFATGWSAFTTRSNPRSR